MKVSFKSGSVLYNIPFLFILFFSFIILIRPIWFNDQLKNYIRAGLLFLNLIYIINRFLKIKFKIYTDEILIFLLSSVLFVSCFFYQHFVLHNYVFPLLLFYTYIGVKSYLLFSSEGNIRLSLAFSLIIVILHIMSSFFIYPHIGVNKGSLSFGVFGLQKIFGKGIEGLLYNSNTFGYHMLLGLILSTIVFYLYRESKVFNKKVFYFISLIILFFLQGSSSRAALLGALVFITFFSIDRLYSKKSVFFSKKSNLYLGLIIIFLFIGFSLVSVTNNYFGAGRLVKKITKLNSSGRFPVWKGYFSEINLKDDFKELLIGHGYRSAQKKVQYLFRKYHNANSNYSPPHIHNHFLEFIVRFGLMGLGIWLIWLIYISRQSIAFALAYKNNFFIYGLAAVFMREMFEADVLFGIFRFDSVVVWILSLYPFMIASGQFEKEGEVRKV